MHHLKQQKPPACADLCLCKPGTINASGCALLCYAAVSCALLCHIPTAALLLLTLQVTSSAITQGDFEAGQVQLSVAASARTGAFENDSTLLQTATADVTLPQLPSMSVIITSATLPTGVFTQPGECGDMICKSRYAVSSDHSHGWLCRYRHSNNLKRPAAGQGPLHLPQIAHCQPSSGRGQKA